MKSNRIILFLIGLVFFISGILKAIDSQGFSHILNQFGIPYLGYFSVIISPFEVVWGLVLMLDYLPHRTMSLVSGIVMLVFTIAFAFGLYYKGVNDCGCMGSSIVLSPYISFLKNILIFILCLYVWLKNKTQTIHNQINWKAITILSIGALTFALSGFTFGSRIINNNNFVIGQKIQNSKLKSYESILSKGSTAVFIFSTRCNYCLNSIENINSFTEKNIVDNVIGITYTNKVEDFVKLMNIKFTVYNESRDFIYKEISSVPLMLIVKDGIIKEVYERGNIPSENSYKIMHY